MNDIYKYDPDGVDKTLLSLKQTRIKYEEQISNLISFGDEIFASSAWKDNNLKTQFMNLFNLYMSIYKNSYTNMDRYEKYLENKSKIAKQIEQNYLG